MIRTPARLLPDLSEDDLRRRLDIARQHVAFEYDHRNRDAAMEQVELIRSELRRRRKAA